MKFSTILFCFFTFIVSANVSAQSDSDNIIIEKGTATYAYFKPGIKIFLEEKSNTTYKCLKWPETIAVAEFYDIYSTISEASLVKAGKKITPVYQMYQEDGVFYSDTKVCYFNIPFTKKEETATVSFNKLYNDFQLFATIPLFDRFFIREKTVEIIVPSWMQLDVLEHNIGSNIQNEKIIDTKSGFTKYIYTIKNQNAVIREEDAPGYYKTSPFLIMIPRKSSLKNYEKTHFMSFDDVYRWCKEKIDMTVNDNEEIASFTRRITADCPTEEDKIAEIFSWVQNNIRYLAFSYGLDGWVPDSAQEVLRKKYGDCKGMSNLLKSMLCSAGLDARLTWIGTNNIYSNTEIPLPMYNHMICALFRNGTITYLDPTVKYMVPGEYHEAIQGRPTMIENGENYILDRVPEIPVSQNKDSLCCMYRIEDNILAGDVSMVLSGESKQYILSQIYSFESSRRMNILKLFLEKQMPQNKVSELSIEGIDSRENTVTINYKERRVGGINKIGDEIYVDLDSRQDFVSGTIDTAKRKSDVQLDFRELTIREEYLEIPDGYEVSSLPDDLYIEDENILIKISYQNLGSKIKYRKEIEIKNTWLKKQNFSSWNNNIVGLKKSYTNQIVLKKIN